MCSPHLTEHLAGGMLDALIERTSVADGEDVAGIFPTRPTDAFAFEEPHGELHFKGNLNAGTHNLAIPLAA